MVKGFEENGLLGNDYDDGVERGKGLLALKKSRDARSLALKIFGCNRLLPSSVMRAAKIRPKEDLDEHGSRRSYRNTAPLKKELENSKLPAEVKNALIISGKGCASGALSMFPQDIGRSMLLLYSEPGDVVVDPFSGHNSRMDLCVLNHRSYIGCDVSADFMKFNRKRAKRLRQLRSKARVELHLCDSRRMPVDDEIGDFTITSPPYWNTEYYGDEEQQLGNCASYEDFMGALSQVLRENYRCLKVGAHAIWFVNDFRKDGRFYSYHSDVIFAARSAGFVHHDIMITHYGRGFRDCFITQTLAQRIIPKCHEYGLVFKKLRHKHEDNAQSR